MTGTNIRTLVIAVAAIVAAASLAGCATAPRPLSVEECIWFDKAQSYDIIPTQPYPRCYPIGYRE